MTPTLQTPQSNNLIIIVLQQVILSASADESFLRLCCTSMI